MKPLILYAALVLAVAGCADDPVAAMAFDSRPVAAAAGATAVQQPSQKVDELVAPIALYPDVLVAQVLAAATQPAEVVHAGLWLDEHRGASAAQLAQAVDGQPWDAGIKALTLLPDVLAALNRNYAWTVALGEAYAADPADVLRAVQAVRRKAQAAGELAGTTEQQVLAEGETILIEAANPDSVRVPGGPVSDVSLGDRFTWGWHSWDVDWQHGTLMYQDAPYLSALE
ncbi:MAG TPA: DUF3300 domain-containing protein [Burkholderiales bacterium]|nr:DUF3300 domain-containing protein [Burkholderiales bacterium]